MRSSLGDFSACTNVAKYAARLGQCFSTTTVSFGTSQSERLRVVVIEDVTAYHHGQEMVHSDGVGLIRRDVGRRLVRGLPNVSKPEAVSCIQIRYGGAKGVLLFWDTDEIPMCEPAHGALAKADICLRPSMIKFESDYDTIEVCSVGRHAPYFLNRHVIFLLCSLGVPEPVFLSKQAAMIKRLDSMIVSGEAAREILPTLGGFGSWLLPHLMRMLRMGYKPSHEPFLFSCLCAIRVHYIFFLRKKSRIFVEDGGVFMGALDESGLVPEGCIFLSINQDAYVSTSEVEEPSQYRPLVRPVMITKHPVMHPGDIRMLLAIDVPGLRNSSNVLLFSQHGTRPEPDKMAGSDLDGDEYAITWDSELFLGIWNCCQVNDQSIRLASGENIPLSQTDDIVRRMAVTNAEPIPIDPLVRTTSQVEPAPVPGISSELSGAMVEHVINHVKNDNLGRICSLWLDHAAMSSAKCSACIELATLHSIAVDFPKSGIPAELPRDLCLRRDDPRPHWREVKSSPTFPCQSVVGKLYDQVVRGSSADISCPALAGRVLTDKGQILPGRVRGHERPQSVLYNASIQQSLGIAADHEEDPEIVVLVEFASNQRWEYESRLTALMRRYHIQSEGEIMTGAIRKYHKLFKRRQHTLSEEVQRQARELVEEYRRAFFEFVWSSVLDDENVLVPSITEELEALAVENHVVVEGQFEDASSVEAEVSPPVEVNTVDSAGDSIASDDIDADAAGDSIVYDPFAEYDFYDVNDDESSYNPSDDESVDVVVDAEDFAWTVKVCTTRGHASGETREAALRRKASLLAAAYYMVTNSPLWGSNTGLFSFPWIISDVMESGMPTRTPRTSS